MGFFFYFDTSQCNDFIFVNHIYERMRWASGEEQ